jgi:hypothetical protein
MDDRKRILLGILADTDSVFMPNRNWTGHRGAVLYERRRDYATAGVPWKSDALDEAGRKAAQRELEALADAGLVKTFRPKRVKTLGVKLADEGEALARAWCGLPDVELAIGMMLQAALLNDDPETGATGDGRVWIPETWLAGVSYGQTAEPQARLKLAAVADKMLPALARGWVVSNSSVRGHVWYAITPDGWTKLEAVQEETDWQPARPAERDPEAPDYYLARVKYNRACLDNAEPTDSREIGDVPLPVPMGRLLPA